MPSRPSRPTRPSGLLIRTIDAHAGGGPLRLVVDGFPSPHGRTMLAKRRWLIQHAEDLRHALVLEPRGHVDMCAALLTEPTTPGSHAGVLFMDGGGVSTMSGHGIVAVTTIALERGLIVPGGDGANLVFDTPAGTVRARATLSPRDNPGEPVLSAEPAEPARPVEPALPARPALPAEPAQPARPAEPALPARPAGPARPVRVTAVSVMHVPSFVLHAGIVVAQAQRKVRVDVAFGGLFYAIVDSESVGLPIDRQHLPELRRAGIQIARAVEETHTIAHPIDSGIAGIAGTIFTAPPVDERASLRNLVIFADGRAERSASGTGTSAVMAVVDAMGLLDESVPFVHESLIGTRVVGRVRGRTMVGEFAAIVPEIQDVAWITGEHVFLLDDDDPLRTGFRM